MRPRELAALLALAALWGGSFFLIRVAAPALGPFPLAAGRVLLAAVVLGLGLRVARRRVALRGLARPLLVLGALNAAIPFALIAAAELQLTASLAAMLNATAPLFASLFGAAWMGERLTPRRIAGLALGLAGVGVLVGWSPMETSTRTTLAVAAMLLGSASYAIAGIYAKRRLAGVPPATLALGQQLGAAAWLVAPAAWTLPDAQPTRAALLALAALAVLSTTVAYLLYFHLIQTVGPTRTSMVTYLLPVFGAFWGVVLLGERVTGGMMLGVGCILASVVLVSEVRPTRVARGEGRGARGGSALGVGRSA